MMAEHIQYFESLATNANIITYIRFQIYAIFSGKLIFDLI